MIKNRGILSKSQALGTYNKPVRNHVIIGTSKKKKVPSMKQYGDKGYKPSNGRGGGY